ncbi:MAG: hypothetical protein WD249_09305 [Gaiellaceae bacterium]
MRFLLEVQAPPEGWTKAEIAEACDLSRNGGATAHVDGLVALELLEEVKGRYRPVSLEYALLAHVAALVDDLESIPDVTVSELLARRRI